MCRLGIHAIDGIRLVANMGTQYLSGFRSFSTFYIVLDKRSQQTLDLDHIIRFCSALFDVSWKYSTSVYIYKATSRDLSTY